MILSGQMPSQIMTSAIENCAHKLVCQLNSGNDIAEMANSLRLSRQQADALARLEIGQCLVKTPRYPDPFLVRITPPL